MIELSDDFLKLIFMILSLIISCWKGLKEHNKSNVVGGNSNVVNNYYDCTF